MCVVNLVVNPLRTGGVLTCWWAGAAAPLSHPEPSPPSPDPQPPPRHTCRRDDVSSTQLVLNRRQPLVGRGETAGRAGRSGSGGARRCLFCPPRSVIFLRHRPHRPHRRLRLLRCRGRDRWTRRRPCDASLDMVTGSEAGVQSSPLRRSRPGGMISEIEMDRRQFEGGRGYESASSDDRCGSEIALEMTVAGGCLPRWSRPCRLSRSPDLQRGADLTC